MNSSDPPSLPTQLLILRTQHRSLDIEINRLHEEFPHCDQLYIQRLKRQKLRIKENIGLIKSMLIPDLDA